MTDLETTLSAPGKSSEKSETRWALSHVQSASISFADFEPTKKNHRHAG